MLKMVDMMVVTKGLEMEFGFVGGRTTCMGEFMKYTGLVKKS